jgi:predicted membrane-bound mannosyltransferase
MLVRALEHDHCMIVLAWLHFEAIGDIMRDSEHEKDPDIYQAASHLAMLLYAKTNALQYIRMSMCYWVNWKICSDVDKVLY